MIAEFGAALLIGFFGSGHCLVMCGGMVSALQLLMPEQSWTRRLKQQLVLSAGRISSYAAMGALFGAIGGSALLYTASIGHWLKLVSGIMLLLMACYVSRWWTVLTQLERLGRKLWLQLQPWSKSLLPLDSYSKTFAYGWLWGYLPCGLVYSGLSWSLASASAGAGAVFMLGFGIGTLPALLAAGQTASVIQQLKQHPGIRITAALFLAAYGVQTIYSSLIRLI